VEYQDDCEIDCDSVSIEVEEECGTYGTIAKVLVNGLPINSAILDWISIDWYLLDGSGPFDDVINDQNCVTFPVGTDYIVIVNLGDCPSIGISSEDVKHPDCNGCEFTVQEICKKGMVELTMLDAMGNPVMSINEDGYIVRVQWAYNGVVYLSDSFDIPLGDTYEAILTVELDGVIICSENLVDVADDCKKGCSEEFTEGSVESVYYPEEDIIISWTLNNALSYEVDVIHTPTGCESEPVTCHFELDETTNSISLSSEDCFSTCRNYNITVTAICADGTTYQVALDEIITSPLIGECNPCGGGGSGDSDDTVGKGKMGKKTIANDIVPNISLYPNPTQNIFNINFDTSISQAHIQVFDLSGKEVLNQEVNETDRVLVEVSDLKASVYMVRISVEGADPVFRKLAIVK